MTIGTDSREASRSDSLERSPGELETRLGALQSFVEHSTRTLQDSIDLAGATFREELEGFASDATWKAAVAFCGGSAFVLLTAAAVFLVQELSGSWSLAFLLPGLVYGTGAALLATRVSRRA